MQYARKSGNTVSIRNEWRAFSHPVALARTTRTITSTTTTARPQPPLIMSTIIISTSPPQRHRPLRFSITPNTGDEAGGPPSSSHEVNVQVHSVRVSLFQRHTTTPYTSHTTVVGRLLHCYEHPWSQFKTHTTLVSKSVRDEWTTCFITFPQKNVTVRLGLIH